jgi:hypothetical protein
MFNKTHASITAGLTKMITDLDALTKANEVKAKVKRATIASLAEEIRILDLENTKCFATKPQLEKIVGS